MLTLSEIRNGCIRLAVLERKATGFYAGAGNRSLAGWLTDHEREAFFRRAANGEQLAEAGFAEAGPIEGSWKLTEKGRIMALSEA